MSQASPRSAIQVSVVTEAAGFAALRQEWRDLWQRNRSATPFQSPEWLMQWWDVFAPGELRIIAVHENGVLAGLAPLYRDGNILRPIGVSLSDYQDILVAPGRGIRAAIASAITAMRDVESCDFDEVSADATVLSLEIFGWHERIACASSCPQLNLSAGAVPPSTLRHLRTARRRAARRVHHSRRRCRQCAAADRRIGAAEQTAPGKQRL